MNLAKRVIVGQASELSTKLITTIEECDIPVVGSVLEKREEQRQIGFKF